MQQPAELSIHTCSLHTAIRNACVADALSGLEADTSKRAPGVAAQSWGRAARRPYRAARLSTCCKRHGRPCRPCWRRFLGRVACGAHCSACIAAAISSCLRPERSDVMSGHLRRARYTRVCELAQAESQGRRIARQRQEAAQVRELGHACSLSLVVRSRHARVMS